jgi:flagellar hook protein FlgE
VVFDAKGVLSLTYSNGDKATGPQVALAVFDNNAELQPIGGGDFTHPSAERAHIGSAGSGRFGSIASSQVEISNVDLSSEFSDLIVTQRGYQASSRLVSTANEMLQDLFDMKSHR